MSWVDLAIVGSVLIGVALGAQRGVLRQVALMCAFYASLVVAARYYGVVAGFVAAEVPSADRTVASAYTLAGITLAGTLLLGWLSHQVYASTALPQVRALDRLAGAGLGAAWSWAVVAFALTVVLYGLTFSWGSYEPVRAELGDALEGSRLVQLVRDTLPTLRDLVQPWLPGGVPAPFSV